MSAPENHSAQEFLAAGQQHNVSAEAAEGTANPKHKFDELRQPIQAKARSIKDIYLLIKRSKEITQQLEIQWTHFEVNCSDHESTEADINSQIRDSQTRLVEESMRGRVRYENVLQHIEELRRHKDTRRSQRLEEMHEFVKCREALEKERNDIDERVELELAEVIKLREDLLASASILESGIKHGVQASQQSSTEIERQLAREKEELGVKVRDAAGYITRIATRLMKQQNPGNSSAT